MHLNRISSPSLSLLYIGVYIYIPQSSVLVKRCLKLEIHHMKLFERFQRAKHSFRLIIHSGSSTITQILEPGMHPHVRSIEGFSNDNASVATSKSRTLNTFTLMRCQVLISVGNNLNDWCKLVSMSLCIAASNATGSSRSRLTRCQIA